MPEITIQYLYRLAARRILALEKALITCQTGSKVVDPLLNELGETKTEWDRVTHDFKIQEMERKKHHGTEPADH